MQSITIELNRLGDAEGVLRLSESYMRAVGNDPIEEAKVQLKQKAFGLCMKKLSYDRFRSGPTGEVRAEAEQALAELIQPIKDLLPIPDYDTEGLLQVDVVTNALELAQLPFEVLEEGHEDIVLTRRVRQQWPRPPVVYEPAPRVLFVWAEPKRRDKRQTVPHDRHRKLFEEVLADWLEAGKPEKTLVEIGNATFAQLQQALCDPGNGFTHVHVLAHGRYDEEQEEVYLLLEDDEGLGSRHSPGELSALYEDPDLPRPGTIMLATCHSGEVDPLEAGGTLGQALHEAGVPVVLASQLALTKTGSDELIRTFLASTVLGEDPRRALRACRDALRTRDDTYYDRVALVGYVHLEADFEDNLASHKLAIALSRLEAASKAAARAAPSQALERFARVRGELAKLRQSEVAGKLLEELLGLQASSLKREAECAWAGAAKTEGAEREALLEASRKAVRDAQVAYREAGRVSRDHHWTGVQSLVLDAVVDGSIAERHWDWIAAHQASRDDAHCAATDEDRFWGLGSIAELHILAPLVDEQDVLEPQDVETMLELSKAIGDWPLHVVVRQLDRYLEWWSKDDAWNLPEKVLERAQAVRDALTG